MYLPSRQVSKVLKELCKTVFRTRVCGSPRARPSPAARPPASGAARRGATAPGAQLGVHETYNMYTLIFCRCPPPTRPSAAMWPRTQHQGVCHIHCVEVRAKGAMSGQHGQKRAPGSPAALVSGGPTNLEVVYTSNASRPAPRPPAREHKAWTSFRRKTKNSLAGYPVQRLVCHISKPRRRARSVSGWQASRALPRRRLMWQSGPQLTRVCTAHERSCWKKETRCTNESA